MTFGQKEHFAYISFLSHRKRLFPQHHLFRHISLSRHTPITSLSLDYPTPVIARVGRTGIIEICCESLVNFNGLWRPPDQKRNYRGSDGNKSDIQKDTKNQDGDENKQYLFHSLQLSESLRNE